MKKWNVADIRAAKGKTKLGCVTAQSRPFRAAQKTRL